MKVFLGVILTIVVAALIFQLVRDKEPGDESAKKQKSVLESQTSSVPLHNVIIEEVIQAKSYTYMRVKEGKIEYWIATIKDDAEVGKEYSFGEALEMTNFRSKELDRTFATIYFISESSESAGSQQNTLSTPASMPLTTMGRPKVELKTSVIITQSPGGISIGELYKNRDRYANKKVTVKGKVVKVNNEVMDRNWVHIQDGTSNAGSFDLTVTTLDFAKVDDIVEFEGTIILNKDFGAGYTYEMIMEGGKIKK
jgi:hypothetical protein